MGQSASKKVASRLTQVATKYGTPVAPSSTTVVTTSSSSSSSSSSSKLSNAAAEAITTTPSAASSSKQDQEQLDFLKTLTHPSQRPHSTDPTSPHTAAVPTSPPSPPSTNHPHPQTVVHPPNDDEYPEMPPDLIKFMTDVGPVQKVQVGNSTETARSNRTTYPPSASAAATPKRHPRMTMAEPATTTTTTTTTHTKKNSRADSSTPARDHTRIHQTMPLSKDYPLDAGFNTMRTTSFSNRQDPVDVNEFGLDVVTLYRFLSNTHPTALATVLATNTAADPDARTEHERLLRLTQQYCEAPVLLSDADLTYVGAHPGRVEDLLTVHQGLTRLDARQAKLVVQDWMDIEDATETESAGVAQSLSRSRLERKARERAAGKASVEPSSSS